MTTYTSIGDVAFGDAWSAASHNLLIHNAAAPFSSAVQYGLLYWDTTTSINAYYPKENLFPSLTAQPPLSGVAVAPIELIESSGAGTQKPVIPQIRYATSPDQARVFLTSLKLNAAAPKLKIGYRMSTSVAAKSVKWNVYIAAVKSTDASMSAKVFDIVNTVTDAANATADTQFLTSVTLTNFSSAVLGSWIEVYVQRDTSVASNHTGTAIVTLIDLVYG